MAGQRQTPIGLEWDDAAYIRKMKSAILAKQQLTEDDVRRAGVKWVARAKAYSPVRTGFMKNNIVMEEGRDGKGFFVAVYCRASYWRFVEFGTRFMAAQPFMRPAYVEALQYLRSRFGGK